MRKLYISMHTSKKSTMISRIMATVIALMFVFTLDFYFTRAAMGVTVEEQAGRKRRKRQTYSDEFTRKAPARRDRKGAQNKDPRLACLLSLIVPGGGHIYLRKDIKGIGFCLLTTSFYSASGYYLYRTISKGADGSEKKSKFVITGVLFAVGVIFHVVGIVEAYNDTIEINETRYYYGNRKSRSPYITKLKLE